MLLFGGKGRFVPLAVLAVVALASCASSEGVQEIEIGSCAPAVAAAGDQVVCQVKDLAEDCTLFFGKTPIAYARNASEDTLTFTVPPTLAGDVNVTARCGEGSQIMIQDGFSVLSPTLNPEVPTSEPSPEIADGGEIITPSAPAAAPSETPSAPEAEQQDPENSPSGGQALASLTVGKAANAIHFSAHRIAWDTGGAKAAYLAGNVFTRSWIDGGLPNPCTVTSDGRYLVTNPEGTDLNPASANFEKAESYREGEQCELRNCKAEIFEDVDTLTPFCRIDLSKETDQVFVRSLAPTGRICLVVQGDDDVWSTTCKTIEAPKPELVVTANSVAISETKPVIELKFDYNYAMGRPKAPGCTELAGSSGPDKNGHGIYVAECPLNQIKTTVSVSLQGVGGGNVASRSFEVTLWKDVVPTLKLFGSAPSTGFGNFTLAYGVTRTYSVRDMESADLFGVIGSCPWVKRVKFKGILGEHVWHPVTVFSDVVGWKQANVEEGTWKLEDETKWSFTIEDFDLTYESANYVVSKPGSSNKFTIHALSETGDVDIISESDDCDGFATLEMDFQWSGKNVKNLIVEGSGGQTIHIDGAKSSLPNAPAGAEDDGVLRIVRDLGYMNSAWTKDMSFVVTAYFHDGGKTEPIPQTVTGFSCH